MLSGVKFGNNLGFLAKSSSFKILFATLKGIPRDFPGGPVVKTPALPLQGVWVQSLVGELRSCMPRGQKKKGIPKVEVGGPGYSF